MKVSVIIKALNEEANIRRTIEAALAAVGSLQGEAEVILADSLSTDRTVDIASTYPIRIVQLTDPADRSCGIGAELGYRIASGDYLYLLDGDMELVPGFLGAAIEAMESNQGLVGVGGTIQEMNSVNAEFRGRSERPPRHLSPGPVDRLNGGGLYRRSAIDQTGYLTNRGLHAFEEYELAIRLRQRGGRLIRLDRPAVRHYGHVDGSFRLLLRRWRSRYAWGLGELLRECSRGPRLAAVMKEISLFRRVVAVWLWWCAGVLGLLGSALGWWSLWGPLALIVLPLAATSVRRKSLVDGVYVLALLCVIALGTLAGLLVQRRAAPGADLSMRVVK